MRILYPTDGSTAARAVGSFLLQLSLSSEDHIYLLVVQQKGNPSDVEQILATTRKCLHGLTGTVSTQPALSLS
jgi:hypothetical protein